MGFNLLQKKKSQPAALSRQPYAGSKLLTKDYQPAAGSPKPAAASLFVVRTKARGCRLNAAGCRLVFLRL